MTSAPEVEGGTSVRASRVRTPRGEFAALECLAPGDGPRAGSALLIPGFTGSKEDFAALLPLLAAAGWAVATYDQRGQLETTAGPHDDFSLAGFAADAAAVADAIFGTTQRVHLVGHSFGGLVATTVVLDTPEPARWASLTLLCSGPGAFTSGPRPPELRAAAERIMRDGLEASYQASLERDAARGLPPRPPAVEEFHHRRFVSSSPDSLSAIAMLLTQAPDRTLGLAALDIPVRLVRGADDDAWPHAVQDELAMAVGTQVAVVAGAGHSPAVDQPELTRDALLRAWRPAGSGATGSGPSVGGRP